MFRLALVSMLIGLLAMPVAGQAASPLETLFPGRYIVAFERGAPAPTLIESLVIAHGGSVDQRYETVLNGFAGELTAGALLALSNDPSVTAIMPDPEVTISAQTVPTGIERILATSNQEAQIDGVDERVDVDVAVLDTGVGPHADLNIAGGKNCASFFGNYSDGHGHGTHVAGTIGAIDNATGVVGVAPGARIWSVKVLDSRGNGYGSWILCGIEWVTANAATIEVANMSLGGATSFTDDNNCGHTNGDVIHQAICASVDSGVTYVVAAGNDGADAAGYFPAQYDEVITVSALVDTDGQPGGFGPGTSVGADDTLAGFSNYGPDVNVIAPGVLISSTAWGGGYATMSGTSMASPHAAGAAALYIATNSAASPADVRSALIAAGHTDSWSGDRDGSKEPLIDASGGDSVPDIPDVHDAQVVSVSASQSVTQGETATVSVLVRNNGTVTEAIDVAINETPDGFSQSQSVTLAAGATETVSFSWTTSTATTTSAHTVTATATVAGDTVASNNSGSAAINVEAAAVSNAISVSDITLSSMNWFFGYRLTSQVYVVSNGVALSGASVQVEWEYPNGSTVSQTATTNSAGYATFSRNVSAKGTYTITVTNVTRSGYTYNSAENVVTSASLTIS